MGKTRIGLTSGKEFTVDEPIDEVQKKLGKRNQPWTEFTAGKKRVKVIPDTVVFLQEMSASPATVSFPERSPRAAATRKRA